MVMASSERKGGLCPAARPSVERRLYLVSVECPFGLFDVFDELRECSIFAVTAEVFLLKTFQE
jgi:hypothetical protein